MYGAETPKRHWAYANSRHVGGLSTGKLRGWAKRARANGGSQACRRYRDKEGESRWHGTSRLKRTEKLIGKKLTSTVFRIVATRSSLIAIFVLCTLNATAPWKPRNVGPVEKGFAQIGVVYGVFGRVSH